MDHLGERLAQGDAAAFAELYDACADRLHHYLTVRLGCRDQADDVLQETFLRLVRARHRLNRIDSLAAFVFTVARNEATRLISRTTREKQQQRILRAEDLFLEANRDYAACEAAEIVVAGLRSLSDEQREVVELKIYAGLTFAEIGEVTQVPLQTAATRYRAALDNLKNWLAKQSP